jgi:hypothetical protein
VVLVDDTFETLVLALDAVLRLRITSRKDSGDAINGQRLQSNSSAVIESDVLANFIPMSCLCDGADSSTEHRLPSR